MSASPAPDDAELRALVGRLTLEDKVRLVVGEDVWSLPAIPAIGLRKLRMSDGPVGVRGVHMDERETSLLFPSPTAQAAAWDPRVARRVGHLMGAQARDKDIHVLLAPTVNMHRTPLGGRHFECYSEDPLLTSVIGAAFAEGVQSAGVGATMKHFVANDAENDRMTYDSRVDERALRELYLAPFEAAVRDARVWLVMSAYNSVNGSTMTENSPLQNDVLKGEWGFDGAVVSDWMAVRSTEAAATGGTDIAMPGPNPLWGDALVTAVRDGGVDAGVLDDKVLRILRLAARVGALGDTAPPAGVTTPDDADDQIREIAAQAMVLLENPRGELPLDPARLRRVALIGPNAVRMSAQGGGSAHVNPGHVVGIPEGLRAAFGPDVELTVRQGSFTHRRLDHLPRGATFVPATGEPGVLVEYLGADGELLGSERRTTSHVILFPGVMPQGTTTVVMKARVTPALDGAHILEAAGIGRFAIRVDDTEHRFELRGDGDIFAGALLHPPLQRFDVPARAGVPVDIELVYGDGAEIFIASVGLGWEAPRIAEDDELDAAVADAAQADVAIVVVGTTDDIESEGFDRTDLCLPGRTDELVARVAAANPRTVVVVNAGSPVLMPWRNDVAAVLWAWLPGQEGGASIADVLTGAVEPGGRLPTTFPAAQEDVPVLSTTPVDGAHDYTESYTIGYRLWAQSGAKPAYPFGYGTGYTDWEYAELALTGDAASGLTIGVAVTNTGARAGREVVQVYLERTDGTLFGAAEPIRLIGFTTVDAAAGTTVTALVTVDARTLARWNPGTRTWETTPGTYRVSVGRNVGDLRLASEITL